MLPPSCWFHPSRKKWTGMFLPKASSGTPELGKTPGHPCVLLWLRVGNQIPRFWAEESYCMSWCSKSKRRQAFWLQSWPWRLKLMAISPVVCEGLWSHLWSMTSSRQCKMMTKDSPGRHRCGSDVPVLVVRRFCRASGTQRADAGRIPRAGAAVPAVSARWR